MKKTLLALVLLISLQGSAQTVEDALRYSQLETGGTARTIGIGGAISALGSDFAVISTNPGGLGNYRKSEFVFTPFLDINLSKANVADGAKTSASRVKFGFQNLGFVFNREPASNKWKTFNVGIGFNQRANFNGNTQFEGRTQGSIADRWLELANDEQGFGIAPDDLDDFEAGLAFETGAIYDPNDSDGITEYVNDFFENPLVLKNQEVDTKGSINEMVFSMAGNYDNKFSFGVTAGLPIVNYTVQKIYTEEDDGQGRDGDIPGFNSLRFVENLTTSGVGFTIKGGVTVRINQALRLGLAAHSPTKYTLNDSYFNLMTFSFNDADGLPVTPSQPTTSRNGVFEYKLSTPFRAIGSFAYILNRKGFITGEVEYVDYSQNNFDLTGTDNSTGTQIYEGLLNNALSTTLKPSVNVKLGGELVLGSIQLRAGLGLYSLPEVDASGFNTSISTGFGYRNDGFYIDLAYRLFNNSGSYSPYALSNDQLETNVLVTSNSHRIISTIGFRF